MRSESAVSHTMRTEQRLFIQCPTRIGFSAVVFSERELHVYAVARPSVCLSVVCNARAPYTQPVKIFDNISTRLVPSPSVNTVENFAEIVPGNPPPSGALNARGVPKYSDFGPIEGYISETVQNRS